VGSATARACQGRAGDQGAAIGSAALRASGSAAGAARRTGGAWTRVAEE
jgi:hypothetical protein